MKKSTSSIIASKISKQILSDVLEQILQREDPIMDMKNETQRPVLGGAGDRQGNVSDSSHSDLEKNTPSREFEQRRSKIPQVNRNQRPQSVGKNNDPQEALSTILHRVVSTEGILLDNLGPALNQITENFIAEHGAIQAKKDAEIAKLRKLASDQKQEIATLAGKLKEPEEKLNGASAKKNKELDKLRADLQRSFRMQKLWVQKENDMLKKIANLEAALAQAEEREKALVEKEKEMSKTIADLEKSTEENANDSEMTRMIQKELDEARYELRCAKTELETRREVADKNAYYKKKYSKKYNKLANEEKTLTRQKLGDLKLWEDELRLREECFKRNTVVKEMRDTLLALLKKRPEWHE